MAHPESNRGLTNHVMDVDRPAICQDFVHLVRIQLWWRAEYLFSLLFDMLDCVLQQIILPLHL